MALDFFDGFDWLTNNSKILQKWNSGAVGGTATTYPRYVGARYLYNASNLKKSLQTSSAYIIIGAALRWNSAQNQDAFQSWEGGNRHCVLRIENLKFQIRRDSSALATSVIGLTEDQWHYVEFEFYVHDSAGYAKVYMDGALVVEVTGADTRNGGTGVVDTMGLYGNNNDCLYDDLYIKTGSGETKLGDVRVCTVLPNGAGTTTEWDPSAGSNYQNVDDTLSDDDTTYNSTGVAGEIDLYAFPDIAVTAGTVHAVQQVAVVRKDDAGARTIKHITRPVSTNHLSSAIGVGDTYEGKILLQATNPETAAAWTIAQVNATEFGIEMEA